MRAGSESHLETGKGQGGSCFQRTNGHGGNGRWGGTRKRGRFRRWKSDATHIRLSLLSHYDSSPHIRVDRPRFASTLACRPLSANRSKTPRGDYPRIPFCREDPPRQRNPLLSCHRCLLFARQDSPRAISSPLVAASCYSIPARLYHRDSLPRVAPPQVLA